MIIKRLLPLEPYMKTDHPFATGLDLADDPADIGVLFRRSGPLFNGAVRGFTS